MENVFDRFFRDWSWNREGRSPPTALIAEFHPRRELVGYLTWDKEANEVEDRIRAIWADVRADRREAAAAAIRDVEARLHGLQLPYEEWEILFRQALLVERALLRVGLEPRARHGALRLAATLIAAAPLIEEAAEVVRETAQDVRSAARTRRRSRLRRSA